MMRLAKHSLENKQTFVFNVSAAFVSQFYKEPLEKLLPYVDLFFGNLEVSKCYTRTYHIPTNSSHYKFKAGGTQLCEVLFQYRMSFHQQIDIDNKTVLSNHEYYEPSINKTSCASKSDFGHYFWLHLLQNRRKFPKKRSCTYFTFQLFATSIVFYYNKTIIQFKSSLFVVIDIFVKCNVAK